METPLIIMNTQRSLDINRLLIFLNEILPGLERKRKKPPTVRGKAEGDTLLFESGLIDSLSILHLMAFVEKESGHEIPPEMITMKHFQTPRTIVESFSNLNVEGVW